MTRWTYRFEPVTGGTDVTETFEMLRDMPWYFRVADRLLMGVADRQADLEANLTKTLAPPEGRRGRPDCSSAEAELRRSPAPDADRHPPGGV